MYLDYPSSMGGVCLDDLHALRLTATTLRRFPKDETPLGKHRFSPESEARAEVLL